MKLLKLLAAVLTPVRLYAVTPGTENPQYPMASSETFVPDQLIAGKFDLVTMQNVTITGSAIYQRGTVLGQITASGKYTIATSAASDGSQNPCAILGDYTDCTGGDVNGAIYATGEFNTNALTLGTGITAAAAKAALRPFSIFLRNVLPATGTITNY